MALTENINLGIDTKQKYSIDGDATRIVEIDTHDVNIITRLSDAIPKMQEMQTKWDKLNRDSDAFQKTENPEDIDVEEISSYSKEFSNLEREMREIVDGIFDSEGMCDTILGSASIFSPVNGGLKYDKIIDIFTKLYGDTIKKEVDKLNRKKVQQKTSKYIRNKK